MSHMNEAIKTVYQKVTEHLASGGVVALHTTYRYTVYEPKHADLFEQPKNAEDAKAGVYIRQRKNRIFVFGHQLKMGRYKEG